MNTIDVKESTPQVLEGESGRIRAAHVGGRGGMGPIEALFALRSDVSFTVFEANVEREDTSWEQYDRTIAELRDRWDVEVSILPYCLLDSNGRKQFHINVMPDCSSLLRMSPRAAHYQRMNSPTYRIVWGQICRPKRTVDIDVTSLDELCRAGTIQPPHFLSIDAQGVEYEIMQGATIALEGDLVGVVTEVEFRELYERQKLFADQHSLLASHGFQLFELYNPEYWYSGPMVGKGAVMVAEALFLRDFRYFIDRDRGAKLVANLARLAAVACQFERTSYALEILDYMKASAPRDWEVLTRGTGCGYPGRLERFHADLQTQRVELDRVPTYPGPPPEPPRPSAPPSRSSFKKAFRAVVPGPVRRAFKAPLVYTRDLIDSALR